MITSALVTLQTPSPVGTLTLVADDRYLLGVFFPSTSHPAWYRTAAKKEARIHAIIDDAREQLQEYWAGGRQVFDIPYRLIGTEFQWSVWKAIVETPYGHTRSYRDLARSIGRARSARPVGQAVGANPLPIIVPCHRILGSDQRLTGYSGGPAAKKHLLKLEGISYHDSDI